MHSLENINPEEGVKVKALDISTNEIITEGYDGEKVIEEAEKSGIEFILKFETDPNIDFVF